MEIKRLSEKALSVFDSYMNFTLGNSICSIPYFNNKRTNRRAAFRVLIGKGSIKDIHDEIEQMVIIDKININNLSSESLKKYLVENNIGIDCSGFAYYILEAENESRGYGKLDKNLRFPLCKGFIGKIKCSMRPIENAGVQTFAHNDNSKSVLMKDILPGDMITIIGVGEDDDRDHILIVKEIEYSDGVPNVIRYIHTMHWPTDGEYGHGIKEGEIVVRNPNDNILDCIWREDDKDGVENYTYKKAKNSHTEIRRLKWF